MLSELLNNSSCRQEFRDLIFKRKQIYTETNTPLPQLLIPHTQPSNRELSGILLKQY